MKNNKFETQAEIYQALLDGKKIISHYETVPILLVGGETEYTSGTKVSNFFNCPQDWSIYEPPKKKVKFYSYVDAKGAFTKYLYSDNGLVWCGTDDKPLKSHMHSKWIKTNTFIEVEL